jgi:hypothetical protein
VRRVVLTPPMIEMLEALFGDTMAIDENNGVVELDLRKDGALIVNGSRLFPDGSWGSAGELIGESVVPLSEVKEALLSEEAVEAAREGFAADCGGGGRHMGRHLHPPHADRIANALNAALNAAFSSTDSEVQS